MVEKENCFSKMECKPLKRQDLRNGDLVAWRKVSQKGKSDFYLNVVRIATFSEFGHVSIVWNRNNVVGHVEATNPRIHHQAIPESGEAYVIRTGVGLTDGDMDGFFSDKLGLKYSFRDAIMGYLGITPPEENRWQCAELSLEFLRHIGYELPNAYTPSRLVRKTMVYSGKPLFYLQN